MRKADFITVENANKEVDRLRAQVEELTQELDQWKGRGSMGQIAQWREDSKQLAAMTAERDFYIQAASRAHDEAATSQAREAATREALRLAYNGIDEQWGEFYPEQMRLILEALTLLSDTTALDRSNKLYAAEQISRIVKFGIVFSIPAITYEMLEQEAEQLRKEAI